MKNEYTNIALYGGAFDPPHKGHFQIIQNLMSLHFINEVWILPSGDRNDKKLLFSFEERIKMIENFIEKFIDKQKVIVKVTDEEIELSKEKQRMIPTVELLEHFEQKYAGHHFYFVIGSDNLETIHKWVRPEKLLSQHNFIIYQRKGYEIELQKVSESPSNQKLSLPKSYFTNDFVPQEISSTFIKKTVTDDKLSQEEKINKIRDFVDDFGIEMLKKKNLI